MRAISLFVGAVLVMLFSQLALAEQNAQPATAPVLTGDGLQMPAAQSFDNAGIIKFSVPDSDTGDVTCFVMRTYYVARVHPKSDETRVVGYSNCQLSSRYEVKRAVREHNDDSQQAK